SPAVPGAPAFVIGDAKNLELEARILADDAGKIKIGDTVEISGKPIDGEKLTGKVEKIAPAAETVTSPLGVDQKRVPVTISITDKTGKIKPGYDLDIKIITQRKKDIIKAPDSAVFDYKGESRVFVVENGRAKLRTVKKGLLSGDDIEITEGLKEGEAILKDPGNDIKEGIRIKPV
ncbi:MAG: HlyD family efflux transporter periplasmic adaptor subunit, partial [Bacillota bacterium]|nr:HlyD family efflux transporter periplasmic adaptor subunit [Bacillota bacterium]